MLVFIELINFDKNIMEVFVLGVIGLHFNPILRNGRLSSCILDQIINYQIVVTCDVSCILNGIQRLIWK